MRTLCDSSECRRESVFTESVHFDFVGRKTVFLTSLWEGLKSSYYGNPLRNSGGFSLLLVVRGPDISGTASKPSKWFAVFVKIHTFIVCEAPFCVHIISNNMYAKRCFVHGPMGTLQTKRKLGTQEM